MQLFLMHVDTPYRMYRERLTFADSNLMLSAHDLAPYDAVYALCALWCDRRLSDEAGWAENRRMRAHIKDRMPSLRHLLSVEDARILGTLPLTRLDELWDGGVVLITPMWRGINRLGGGYDTEIGLTTYGTHVLSAAMERGMLIDVSHASERSAADVLKLAKHYRLPVLATHSNFSAVVPHPRNLSDRIAYSIAESGGLIGLSLVPDHVGGCRDLPSLYLHYAHGLSLGLGDVMCLGTDLDGTDTLISPLQSAKDLLWFVTLLNENGHSSEEIEALFSRNAERLFRKYFPCRLC